jgi:tight adherence protein B
MQDLLDSPLLLGIGLAAGLVAFCFMLALSSGSAGALQKRTARVSARARGEALPAAETLNLRRNAEGGFDQMVKRLLPRPELLRQKLARTGRQIPLGTYFLICLAVGLFWLVGLLFTGRSPMVAIPAALVFGLVKPNWVINRLIARRNKKFEALFPEAIGLIVRGLRSGLPATESMQVAGREIADPVGEEFRRISDQIRLGQPLEQALWDAAKRVGTTEFNFLVVTMVVQRETGGNLAETLENLDQVLRRRRQMRLKIKAMSSEARASAMIIGSLPFVMFGILFLINNAYIMTLVTTHAGNMMLALAGGMLLTGVAVMAKLIRFEI